MTRGKKTWKKLRLVVGRKKDVATATRYDWLVAKFVLRAKIASQSADLVSKCEDCCSLFLHASSQSEVDKQPQENVEKLLFYT